MSGIVLCALDVHDPDHDAPILKRAAQIAELDGARLDVITVVPDFGNSMVSTYFSPDFLDKAVEEAREALGKMVTDVLGPQVNEKVRHVVAVGNVYEKVLQVADADGATVIVIGSHRPELRDYLLGPNAARVVRHSRCSVFVVRQG